MAVPCRRSRLAASVPAAACLLLALAIFPPAGQRAEPGDRIDLIFEPWSARGAPGCAVSVMRGGDVLFAKGFGDANLEYDVPIAPASVFHVASVSKQFTAMAVGLLVADGRISWDDDVRRYVPELPDFGEPIALRHLAHHTSGIRDQWSLLQMAGWRWGGDVVTQGDVLDLLSRQTAVHFPPGSDYLYSNSGYTLLAVVVERVSGQTLREFTAARVFEPLGMTQTTFRDDHAMLVRNRAYAYERDRAGGYRLSIPDFDVVGATSLFTTVEDLAHWNRNFRTGEVGGRPVVRQLQERGTLDGGARISYAFGLAHGMHRGHGDHRARRDRRGIPQRVRALSRRRPRRGGALQRAHGRSGTAGARRGRPLPPARPRHGVDPCRSERPANHEPCCPGRGRSGAGGFATRHARPGDARGSCRLLPASPRATFHCTSSSAATICFSSRRAEARPLRPLAEGRFRIAGTTTVAAFEPDGAESGPTLRLSGPMRGVYTHAAPVVGLPGERLAGYAGSYHSEDLDVRYVFREENRRLVLSHRKLGHIRLIPTFEDGFYGGGWYFTFRRDASGEVAGFTMSTSRAWRVAFRKLRQEPARE